MPSHGKGGRKAHFPQDGTKRKAINMRTTQRIYDMLSLAAQANGRSLASEMEQRILISFTIDILEHWRPWARSQ